MSAKTRPGRRRVKGSGNKASTPRVLTAPAPHHIGMRAGLGPAVIVVAALIMLFRSWGTWPDVLVDFGRELYVPWQLAAGKVLYRDVAYFYGPLSPYWNSLWFRLFGAHLLTIVVSNLLVMALLLSLVYGILSNVGSRLSAIAACLTFVALFGFAQFVGIGNYNWVCPYSHAVTHGTLLAVAAIFCLWRYQVRRGLGAVAGAGVSLGLLYLTKPEVFVAGALATVIGLGLILWGERLGVRKAATVLATFALAAMVPLLGAVALFSLAMPFGTALRQSLGYWLPASNVDVSNMRFYRQGLGLDDVGTSLTALGRSAFWYLMLLGPAAALGLALRKRRDWRVLAAVASVVVAGGLGFWWRDIRWYEAGRPLPLFMALLAIGSLVLIAQRPRNSPISPRVMLGFSMILFALVMLLKMILNARIYHYGFALAMPATLVFVVALLDWVPSAIDRAGGHGVVFRAVGLGALLVAVLAHLQFEDEKFAAKTYVVGAGADAFRADARGPFVNMVLAELRTRAAAGQSVAVFPEGVMINYLSRRENPTPYTFFTPFDLMVFKEDPMLDAFEGHPPDYVALVSLDTSEFGPRFFGRDYGRKLGEWIRANYHTVSLFGAVPLQDGRFGIALLQRNQAP